jgi:hypothetical protein
MGAGIVQLCSYGFALLIDCILLLENILLVVVNVVPVSLVGHNEERKDDVVGESWRLLRREELLSFERKVEVVLEVIDRSLRRRGSAWEKKDSVDIGPIYPFHTFLSRYTYYAQSF